MIDFNVPPYVGTELKYVAEAVEKNHKICGDGPFTKRCNAWLEEKTGTSKALLTTSCTMPPRWQHCWLISKKGMR